MKLTRRLATVTVVVTALVLSTLGTARAGKNDPDNPPPLFQVVDFGPRETDNAILKWNEELLQAVRALPPGPTVVARAIAVVHTATYDAWAAYDPRAKGTRYGSQLRQPAAEHTPENKQKAISFAAYTALVDLFPSRRADFAAQMEELGYLADGSDASTPAAVGTQAAQAVLDFRHGDGSNQLGGYTDTTGYTPVNTGDTVTDRWRWQPLRVPLGTGPEQRAATPQWKSVTSFALTSPFQYKVPGPPRKKDGSYDTSDIDQALKDTANLDDARKVKAEYWADGPRSEFPPGHWAIFAQVVSRKRGHSLDTDAKLFFALGSALMDASIAAWAAKYQYDFVRPITAIREYKRGKDVTSWLGPYKGFGKVKGEQWVPYQAPNVVTPPFPEYVSGHSTFSAAGAQILANFTGSDAFGAGVVVKAGTSLFEPRTTTQTGTPAGDVTMSWPTFTAAADEAGWSRRYGGIHFASGDENGRTLGRSVGWNAWGRAQLYILGLTSG
jgi:hypothetical protein